MTQQLRTYLNDRTWQELRTLQQHLSCRVDGDRRVNADLCTAILAYAASDGLTVDEARYLVNKKV